MDVDKYGDKFQRVLLKDPVFKTNVYYAKLWGEKNLWIPINSHLAAFLKAHPYRLRDLPWSISEATDDNGEDSLQDGMTYEYIIFDSWSRLTEDNIKIEFTDVWPKEVNNLQACELISKFRDEYNKWESSTKPNKTG